MNYLKWSYSLLILIIVFSIQTKDLMPNVMELLPPNQHRKLASLALTDTWSSKYKQATRLQKKSPQLACPLFSQLSQQPHFPLNKIAFLRAHENCSQKEKLANKLKPLNYSALPQWLQPLALNYVIKQSRQKKDYEKSFEYMLIKSKLPLPLKEKVQHTKEALNIAKTHQLKSNLRKSLQRLYKLAPRLIPNPTKINFLKIAHDYKRSQFFSLARAYYRKVFKLRGFSYSQKIIALKGIEKTYKLENKKKLYLSTAKQLAQFATKNLILYPHKKFLARSVNNLNNSYARKLWTSGKIKLAKSILLKNTKLLKNKISLHKSYWILSRMASEKKQHLAAIWWLEQAKGEPRINSHAQNNIYWHLFWNYKKLKQTKSAITIIDEAISKNTKHKQKFSFWKAKILKDNGHYLQANTLFKTIVEADTLGYYGLLAHRELNLKITKPTRPIDDMGHSINKSYKIKNLFLDWLISVDEFEVAKSYLDNKSHQFKKNNKVTKKEWNTLFKYYAKSGNYLGLFYQLKNYSINEKKSLITNYPSLIFPTPFKKIVETAANKFKVLPAFIYSIMRQESAFNPNARSHANAFGLMQVLPRVAKKTALTHSLEYSGHEDLYAPPINIPIGTSFLRTLLDRFKGQFILTVSSYNASEKAIQNWLQSRYNGNAVEFIEDIPYEETRNYVKLVLRNYVYYKALSSNLKKIPFPEDVLFIDPNITPES